MSVQFIRCPGQQVLQAINLSGRTPAGFHLLKANNRNKVWSLFKVNN